MARLAVYRARRGHPLLSARLLGGRAAAAVVDFGMSPDEFSSALFAEGIPAFWLKGRADSILPEENYFFVARDFTDDGQGNSFQFARQADRKFPWQREQQFIVL